MAQPEQTTNVFAEKYPSIAEWAMGGGFIEIGFDYNTSSFIRALDEGGMVWEGDREYATMDAALSALEQGLIAWNEENG